MGIFGDVFGGLGGLGSGIALLSGAAGGGGKDDLKRQVSLWEKLQMPNFDTSQLTFPELKMLQEMDPQQYSAIVPGQAATVNEAPDARAQQMAALGQLQGMGQEGLNLGDRLAAQEAGRSVSDSARRAQMAVLGNLAQRGRLGAGDELQARMAANQQASELARGLGSDLTRQALDRRLGAAQAAGGLAGQIRGQDVNVASTNADIINRFNSLVAGMQNEAAQRNAAARQEVQGYNVGTRQRLGEQTQLGKFNTTQENLNRRNDLRQQQFGNQVTRAQGMSNSLGNLANAGYAEQAAKAAAIRGLGQGAGQAVGGGLDIAASNDAFGSQFGQKYRGYYGGY